jgi:hypothetical protein
MECYLRRWDFDSRCYGFTRSSLTNQDTPLFSEKNMEFLLTTRSFDVPAPPATPPVRECSEIVPSGSIVELFRHRLSNQGIAGEELEKQIDILCAWELRRGEKFDINRPWGNGKDDDQPGRPGFGVVDDPGEFRASGQASETTYAHVDLNSDDSAAKNGSGDIEWPSYLDNGTDVDPRALFARHLFALAMFLKDHQALVPMAHEQTGISQAKRQELTAQRLAQWAVNVVDFRDADMIMTGFEYDQNPYDGWGVDGHLETVEHSTDRRVVWGCELPVLLLTESLAFHDRRVSDLNVGGMRRDDET